MSKQEIKVVLGIGFGDEGKGNTVQWLCKEALLKNKTVAVVRFSGGPQAAHRIVNNGIEHICSSYGSGSLLNIPTYWVNANNTFIDPIAMMQERYTLLQKEIALYPQLAMNLDNVRWITPYDVLANQLNEKALKDGTCGKGIITTFKRYAEIQKSHPNFNNLNPNELLEFSRNYWYLEKDDYLERRFIQSFYELLSHQTNVPLLSYDVLIYEGSQGLLLDQDSVFYPNVTPSQVGLQTLDINNAEIYLCSRVYLTRHGNGYVPKGGDLINHIINIEDVCNPENKFQGAMKYGLLDTSLFKLALKNISVSTNLVLTHCDTIKGKMIPYIWNDKLCLSSLSKFTARIKKEFRFNKIFESYSDDSSKYITIEN